ncbi:MAG: ABC transporter substrate-binding protein [bacterium]
MHKLGLRAALWLLALASLLVSCSRDHRQVTLMVGGAPAELDYWESLVRDFSAATGIEVSLMRQPTDTDQRRQSLVIPLKAGETDPDVFLMDIIWIGQFAASGWLEDLHAHTSRDRFDLGPFFPGMLNFADTFEGKLVALPVYVDAGLLYCRTDLLARYGYRSPPETWTDLVEIASRVQAAERQANPGFWGFVWQGAQYEGLVCNFLEYALSNGGGLVDQGGRLSLDHPKNIEALQFMRDLIASSKVSPPNTYTEMMEEEVRTSFESGNALFERNWPYAWGLHQAGTSPVRDRVEISLLPGFPGGERVAALGGWHVAVSATSDSKQASWELVKFIVSPDVQIGFATNLGWNPARQDLYDSPQLLERAPHLVTLKDVFARAAARPNLPYYSLVSRALAAHLNAALSGSQTPAEALKEAQDEALGIVETYGR